MGPIGDFKSAFYVALAVAAVLGWAVIEGFLWLISHIEIHWVWQ